MPEVRVVVSEEFDKYLDSAIKKGLFGSKAELLRAALISYTEKLPTRVPKGYDTTAVFSPDGRIFQIEYALESAARGSPIVGLKCPDGVILAKERIPRFAYVPEPLTIPLEIFKIDNHIGATFVGLGGDFNVIMDKAVREAETHAKETGKPIAVKELVKRLCLFIQSYTMRKDLRPLGCLLFIGGVAESECHLFGLDPSGSYREVLANAAGLKRDETLSILKEGYKPDMHFEDALGLTIKALLKEKTKKPEEIAIAVIEAKTKAFRKIALEEKKKAWNEAFKTTKKSA